MKQNAFMLVGILILLTSCASNYFGPAVQGEGPMIAKRFDLAEFEKIHVETNVDVELSQANSFKVEARGHQNLLDILDLSVENGTLHIDYDKNARGVTTLFIDLPVLRAAYVTSSGSITGTNNFNNSRELKVVVSGSGRLNLMMEAEQLEANVSGSGSISLNGNTSGQRMSVSGSGQIRACDLKGEQAKVNVSGSGGICLNAAKDLEANVSGSGDIVYVGEPKIRSNISGSGTIRQQ